MKKLKTLSLACVGLFLVSGLIVLMVSCKKSDNSTSISFSGKYCGSIASTNHSSLDTIVITSEGSSIVMNSRTSLGSVYSINGTVSGNDLSITSQSVFLFGVSNTVTGTGTLNNSNLVIHYVFVTPGIGATNWTFSGTKQ